MNTDKKILQYSREITVAVSHLDFCRCLKPSAVMGYFQDVATEHADILGIGYDDLLKKGLAWVMIRMSFVIRKSPKIGEILTISTFPEKPKNSDVNRGYYVRDKSGKIIISASSKWCVLDVSTQKVQRLAPIFEKFGDDEYTLLEPLENANPKIEKLSENAIVEPFLFTVQVTDLDHNGHMNNTRYGDVILNALGVETLRKHAILRIDINFMAQLFIGDKYEVFKERTNDIVLIEARKSESGAIIFKARVELCTHEPQN